MSTLFMLLQALPRLSTVATDRTTQHTVFPELVHAIKFGIHRKTSKLKRKNIPNHYCIAQDHFLYCFKTSSHPLGK